MPDFEHPKGHQITTIDEFTIARIHRLWKQWLNSSPPERRTKHQFHRNVISREPGLGSIRLATVYVVLARHDAEIRDEIGSGCSSA